MAYLHYAQQMKLRIISLTMIALVSLALAPAPARAASATVKATASDEWTPEIRRIEPGDRIVWKNPTEATHNIVGYGSNWSLDRWLYAGDTFSKRFPAKGTYRYRCSIHSSKQDGPCDGMCGVIRVVRP